MCKYVSKGDGKPSVYYISLWQWLHCAEFGVTLVLECSQTLLVMSFPVRHNRQEVEVISSLSSLSHLSIWLYCVSKTPKSDTNKTKAVFSWQNNST